MNAEKPNLFPHSPYVENKELLCEDFSDRYKDSIMLSLEKDKEQSYSPLLINLCEHYNIFHFTNYDFLYNEILFMINREYKGYVYDDYEFLYEMHYNDEMYDLFTQALILYRPISYFLRERITTPLVDEILSEYINMNWIYMGFGIVIGIANLIVIRFIIMKGLMNIFDDLKLLCKCFFIYIE